MPVQAWCNIQGFIQSLHTVQQSEIYSEPSTKVRQVLKDFQMKFTKHECVWVCVSLFLFSVHVFSSVQMSQITAEATLTLWEVSRAKIIKLFFLSDPLNIDHQLGCQILAKLVVAPPLPWCITIHVSWILSHCNKKLLTQFTDTRHDIKVTWSKLMRCLWKGKRWTWGLLYG